MQRYSVIGWVAGLNGLLFLVSALFAVSLSAQVEFPQRRSITVRVYDYASIDESLLVQARAVAERLLSDVGVDSNWEQCRTSEAGQNLDTSCQHRADETVLQLRIQPNRAAKKLKLTGCAMGYAVPPPDQYGVIAGVFLERMRRVARSEGRDLHVLLGHVMAHELGHLLMGSSEHDSRGIMRRRWNSRDLLRAARGNFGFNSVQGALMRRQADDRVASANGRLLTVRHETGQAL